MATTPALSAVPSPFVIVNVRVVEPSDPLMVNTVPSNVAVRAVVAAQGTPSTVALIDP